MDNQKLIVKHRLLTFLAVAVFRSEAFCLALNIYPAISCNSL